MLSDKGFFFSHIYLFNANVYECFGGGVLRWEVSFWVIISLPKRDPSFFQARTHQIHLQIHNSFVSGLCVLPKFSRPSASKSQVVLSRRKVCLPPRVNSFQLFCDRVFELG